MNKLSEYNVITLNYAASSIKSTVKLSIPDKKTGQTIYSSIISNRSPTEKIIKVNANTLIYYMKIKYLLSKLTG